MAGSVNTNTGAQIALQNLNITGSDLANVQKQISTGLRVSDAFDNGAVFAIAQGLRSDISALTAVNGQLGAACGLLNVTDAALTAASKTFQDVRSTLIQLADSNVTGNARAQLNSQFSTQIQSYFNTLRGANYQGNNILKPNVGSGVNDQVNVIKDADGNQITISADYTASGLTVHDSYIGGPGGVAPLYPIFNPTAFDANGYTTAVSPNPPADATAAAGYLAAGSDFTTLESNTLEQANSIAAQKHLVDNQITLNNAISDATAIGLGSLVDADLAKESAKLQSLQIKQQLGTQSLGIANQTPQSLLGLFR
jgi:flagellin